MAQNLRIRVSAEVDPDRLVGVVRLEPATPITGGTMDAQHARKLGRALIAAADDSVRAAERARAG